MMTISLFLKLYFLPVNHRSLSSEKFTKSKPGVVSSLLAVLVYSFGGICLISVIFFPIHISAITLLGFVFIVVLDVIHFIYFRIHVRS